MRIHYISDNNSRRNSYPNFKSKIAIDVGGSTTEGSCKVSYLTNQFEEIYTLRTTLNNTGKKTFKNTEEVLEKIAEKIEKAQKEGAKIIEKRGLPKEENTLKGISLMFPSYTYGTKVLYTANLRNEDHRPLKDIDFSKLPEYLEIKGVKTTPDLKIKLMQDAMGSGLAITKKLYEKGMLIPGSYYTIAITGGGCGIANVRGLSNSKALVDSSGSSYLTDGLGVVKISKLGASAPSVIKNFCKAFGIDEETTEDIASCGIGYFVTNPITKYPDTPQGEKLRKLLLSTGKYEEITNEYGENMISVKTCSLNKFEHARYNAINKYAHALARLAVIKQNESSNGLIITGPLAMALDNSCRNNYQTTLAQWIQDKIEESYNTYELHKMKSKYGFKVLCSKDFALEDNTAGAELALEGNFIGDNRFNWLEINLDKLNKVNDNIK